MPLTDGHHPLKIVAVGVNLLGPVSVDDDGALEPRDRLALAALAVRRGQVVHRDELADALWGDDPPSTADKQVQICVSHLRKVLGADAIETTSGGYRLAARRRRRRRRPVRAAGRARP